MRGWLMRRCSARSLTLSSPTLPSRSRMRRRVGVGKRQEMVRQIVIWVLEKHKGCFYRSLMHKGPFMR